MLGYNEQETILSNFPNIKLSYENITHNKVCNADIFLAIPEGIKCFAWFTYHNDNVSCFILELTENKKINIVKRYNACFNDTLAYGTIFYGTCFYHLNNKFFNIEDIFYYKGTNVSNNTWGNKLILFQKIMHDDIKQVSYNNSFIVFGLPLLSNTLVDLLKYVNNIKYKINSIQFRLYNKKNISLFKPLNSIIKDLSYKKQNDCVKFKTDVVFNIKPDVKNDIYHLYCENNGEQEYYNIALIPDYKTSVMMNSIFRNIKENKNLDALEESDSDEEFENENEDRFVDLDKSYKMYCTYNNKFKKWVPKEIVNDETILININKLKHY